MAPKTNSYHVILIVMVTAIIACGLANAETRDFARATPHSAITLCHASPGAAENPRTITVSQWAASAHLAHGDTLGPCCEAGNGVLPVPKTGQTISYEAGDDGDYQAGVSAEPRFIDNRDGTITDALTGLIWLRDTSCMEAANWNQALYYASIMSWNNCGLTDDSAPGDWRLPNVRELQSLIDFGEYTPALPDGHPFLGVRPSRYWSSTMLAGSPGNVYFVDLDSGRVDATYGTDRDLSVWPVRGGK